MISQLDTHEKFLVSFDVASLFTNIPLNETIDIAVNLICTNEPDLKITPDELRKLFHFATSQSHFTFKGGIYDQVDGVAMGSPLGPVLANVFMGYHERNWINNCENSKPIFYTRYVDDIFCLFENEGDGVAFLDYLNSQHPNIQFTIESEVDGKLSFLDVNIDKNHGSKPSTSIFRKTTFTGLMMNFLSYNPLSFKRAHVRTLVHRVYKICNTTNQLHADLLELKHILARNMFPSYIIEKEIKSYLNDKMAGDEIEVEKPKVNFYKLPYIRDVSEKANKQIRNICEKFCKETKLRLSFGTFKIGCMFSAKDKLVNAMKSFVIYRFSCPGCNARYIGETTRHLSVRIDEHLTKMSSHIFKHLEQSQNCKPLCDETCFEIIDTANSAFALKIKEAMHIGWEKPNLNVQQMTVQVSITV